MSLKFALLFVLTLFGGGMVHAAPLRCDIDSTQSSVQFSSEAPFETFVGKTNEVRGWVEVDVKTARPLKGEVIVDAASLKTGNRLRDKDMRKKFLETAQFPEIRFSFERAMPSGTIKGKFTIHGVTRDETVPATFTVKDDVFKVTSSFPITLADYQIERPKFLWMRLKETVDVSAQLTCLP